MSPRRSTATSKTSTGMTFRLNQPGMGEYERAGLAGLYLSLTAARVWHRQRRAWPLPAAVVERLDDLLVQVINHDAKDFPLADDGYGLCLKWHPGTEIETLKAIVNWAWQVQDGVLFLPGVHRKREHLDCYYLRLHVHSGLLGTYFQHPKHIKGRRNWVQKVERFDEEKTFTLSYQSISPEAQLPQFEAVPRQGVCDDSLARSLANWVYPGSEPRFKTKGVNKEGAWRGFARVAYLMLFAPIACHFIKLPRSIIRTRSTQNWAFTVPHIRELPPFQREFLRHNTVNRTNWPFYGEVAGLEDASLRYAVRNKGGGGQALTVVMGNAPYYHKNQKTRKNLWREFAVADHMATAFSRYDARSTERFRSVRQSDLRRSPRRKRDR